MIVKCGRRKFDVTSDDLILDNGACYQIITQHYGVGFNKLTPVLAKSTFKKLLKKGKIVKTDKLYKNSLGVEYIVYRFNMEDKNNDEECKSS